MRLLFVAIVLLGIWSARAGTPAETNSFRAAFKLFQDTFYEQAEAGFANFTAAYTNSTFRAEAILYQARARFSSTNHNFAGAVALLEKELPRAGELADNYHFWIAKSLFEKGDMPGAGESFGNLLKNFPHSGIRLEAAYNQALAFSKLTNWARVTDLLRKADGDFQKASAEQPKSEFVVRGLLLLGDALFAQSLFDEGEKVIRTINAEGLPPEFNWQRQYLLCRTQLAAGRAADARLTSTNLVALAAGQRRLEAATTFLQGEILEKLGQLAEAVQVYTNNLAAAFPPDVQRQALFKAIELNLKQSRTQNAITLLESFVAQKPTDSVADQARLTLGELHLKNFYTLTEKEAGTNGLAQVRTNALQSAMTNFDRLIADFPQSTNVGKAWLDRGWCFWELGRIPEARTNFFEAANRLPVSEAQAIAWFKLADTQFLENDLAAATTSYKWLLKNFEHIESVKSGLFDHALYQLLRASVERGDKESARAAATKIAESFPKSFFAERSLLVFGQQLNRNGDYAEARKAFGRLLESSPETKLRPEVQFAIARTHAEENDWATAAAKFGEWVTNYPQHALFPQAEFCRAIACDKAGDETNALTLMTNFVATFPSNNLAPWAQNWIADYYFNHDDFVAAEKNYQEVYKRFPNAGDLSFQARLMAGRAAFARQSPKDIEEANNYFADFVVNATNAPPALINEAFFALADTAFQQFIHEPNSTNFSSAINALKQITNGVATNALAVRAVGRLGDYYMTWAEKKADSTAYANVIAAYQLVLQSPPADVAARSQAEIGLGIVAEKQGETNAALAHYQKIIYEMDPDRFDPYWVKEAGVRAAQICENAEQWDKAVFIYDRVLKAVPSLETALRKKIANAQSHLEAARK